MQGQKSIAGYRELDQESIDLINRINAHGEETKKLIEEVERRTAKQFNAARGDEEKQAIAVEAMGWEEEGKRYLRTGYMYLTRAVAQPTTFA
ncbi:TPA: hypothetical protein QDB21_005666 [Burkholderia vietnamiensis]|nr:hypothetical protein [Burkholderia vietnamiensis]